MAWQYEVGSGTDRATTYQDFLSKIVAMATSQHVATVAVAAGGSGYTVGDVVTLTHAGAYLDARFEVLTIGGGGSISTLRIVASGAFANRIASATVSAGGTGYAVNDILEVQGGSAREKGKVKVATLSGSAVATVAVFESGGAYSSTPSNPASTTKVGPNAGTGSGCTLMVSYTSLVGTSGLSVTGGTGSSATVNITLAQTGWSVDNRNTNNTSFNGVTNEKEVVLKGDASGRTNKPYIGFTTFTRTSGLNTRYAIGMHPMLAHNQAISLASQVGIVGNPGTWSDERPYILCDENAAQAMDFWLSINDRRICGVLDLNSGASVSDDRQFIQFYVGMLNSYATEVEDPYPMFVFGCRATNIDPSVVTTNITGFNECISPGGGSFNPGILYFRPEDSTWVYVFNSREVASQENTTIIAPMGNITEPTVTPSSGTNPSDVIGFDSPTPFHTGVGSLNRSSSTRRLYPIPGTTPKHYPFPLTLVSRGGAGTVSTTLDFVRGELDGCYWIYNTDAAGSTITNFALDYITIGSDRYRVFHNHMNKQEYNYICIKEDV